MAIDIGTFKEGAMKSGGFRPTLFSIESSTLDRDFSLLCNASQVPAMTMGVIEIPYFGRKIKVAGVRSYTDWQVTIINDEDFLVRRTLEAWHAAINSSEGNIRAIDNYRSTAFINQYGKAGGEAIRSYTMENCWPIQISPIDLAWDNGDAIEEFTVTWAFDYWNVADTDVRT